MVDLGKSIFGDSVVVNDFHWDILVSNSLQSLRMQADPMLVSADGGRIWALNRLEVGWIIQLVVYVLF